VLKWGEKEYWREEFMGGVKEIWSHFFISVVGNRKGSNNGSRS
jgi:hypothetical protein